MVRLHGVVLLISKSHGAGGEINRVQKKEMRNHDYDVLPEHSALSADF
jgi:hypothetical protein